MCSNTLQWCSHLEALQLKISIVNSYVGLTSIGNFPDSWASLEKSKVFGRVLIKYSFFNDSDLEVLAKIDNSNLHVKGA